MIIIDWNNMINLPHKLLIIHIQIYCALALRPVQMLLSSSTILNWLWPTILNLAESVALGDTEMEADSCIILTCMYQNYCIHYWYVFLMIQQCSWLAQKDEWCGKSCEKLEVVNKNATVFGCLPLCLWFMWCWTV